MEYMDRGIRVNAIAPGGVDTPMNRRLEFPEGIDWSLVQRYSGRRGLAQPEEIADAVAYIASPEARVLHGAIISPGPGNECRLILSRPQPTHPSAPLPIPSVHTETRRDPVPPKKRHQTRRGPVARRNALPLLLIAALGLSCASTAPPLASNLEALVDESRNLEGLLNRYASTEGKFRDDVSATTFRSWFKPPELLIVRAVTKGFDGNNRETHAYYRNNKPFYGVEWTQIQFQERTELQVFLDPSGAVIGSRSQGNGHLVPMPARVNPTLSSHGSGASNEMPSARGGRATRSSST